MGRAERIRLTAQIETQRRSRPISYRTHKIEGEGITFVLCRDMVCDLRIEGSLWVISYEPLGIHAYADSREGAIAELGQEFAMLWDEYASADDASLSQDAAAIKTHLQQLVREVLEE